MFIHHRFLKITIVGAFILGLALYAVKTGPDTEITFQEINDRPDAYLNQTIAFGGRSVGIDEDNHLVKIRDRGQEITILNAAVPIGENISGKAKIILYNNAPTLDVLEYHIHTGRWIKIISGPIVLGSLMVWFFLVYRFDFTELIFIKKSTQ